MAVFILEDALSVQTDWPFLYYSRIIRLDELGPGRANIRSSFGWGGTRRVTGSTS